MMISGGWLKYSPRARARARDDINTVAVFLGNDARSGPGSGPIERLVINPCRRLHIPLKILVVNLYLNWAANLLMLSPGGQLARRRR